MSVLIVGSIALDSIKTPFGEVERALGGSATYSSLAASHFAPVRLVGVVGKDFPKEHLELLNSRDIDIEGVHVDQEKDTFHWKGYYEYDLAQAHTVETHLNAFEVFNPIIPDAHRDSKYVFLANIDPDLQLNVLDQIENPELVMCDTMNFWIDSKKEQLLDVFRRVDVILINEAEARQLCDTPHLQLAAKELLALGPTRVVIKKGEHGCLMFGKDSYFVAPAFPLEDLVDPTGAGDTFAGGFIGYVAKKGELSEEVFRQAIVVGSTMASFIVQGFSVDKLVNLTRQDMFGRCSLIKNISHFEECVF